MNKISILSEEKSIRLSLSGRFDSELIGQLIENIDSVKPNQDIILDFKYCDTSLSSSHKSLMKLCDAVKVLDNEITLLHTSSAIQKALLSMGYFKLFHYELSNKDTEMKKRIVCTYTDEVQRELLQEYLSDNYELTFAPDGKKCLELIHDNVPDLLLLKPNLPLLKGTEVLKKLKNDPVTQTLPIIILTANAMKDVEFENADDVITLPYNHNELISKVDRLINKS